MNPENNHRQAPNQGVQYGQKLSLSLHTKTPPAYNYTPVANFPHIKKRQAEAQQANTNPAQSLEQQMAEQQHAEQLALEQQRLAQQQALEQQQLFEQQRLYEQQQLLEQQRLYEQQQALEQQRLYEQQQALEQQRLFEQQQQLEHARQLEQQRLLEQQRQFEQQQALEQQALAQQHALEQQRIIEQQAQAQQNRQIQQQEAQAPKKAITPEPILLQPNAPKKSRHFFCKFIVLLLLAAIGIAAAHIYKPEWVASWLPPEVGQAIDQHLVPLLPPDFLPPKAEVEDVDMRSMLFEKTTEGKVIEITAPPQSTNP